MEHQQRQQRQQYYNEALDDNSTSTIDESSSKAASATAATAAATAAAASTAEDDNNTEVIKLLKYNRVECWKRIAELIKSNPSNFSSLLRTKEGNNSNILSKIVMSRNVDATTRLWLFKKALVRVPALAVVTHVHSLPIHHTVRNLGRMDCQTKYSILNLLIETFPQGLIERDPTGQTPLHIACCRVNSVKEIKLLLRLDERAAFVKDNKGNLPIHIALCRKCTAEKLKVLYNAHPDSLYEMNNRGYNPITLASNESESHLNKSLIVFLKKKLLDNAPEMSESLSSVNLTTNAAAATEDSPTTTNSSQSRNQGSPPEQIDVVDLVYTSDSDNDEDDESMPDSPDGVKSEESSVTLEHFTQTQDYATTTHARTAPLLSPQYQQHLLHQQLQQQQCVTNAHALSSPLSQVNPLSSHHQQYMTLDHRLAAAQAAAFPNQIAMQAGSHMISLPRAPPAHFPQTTSLAQSNPLGLATSSGATAPTDMAAAQYQVQQIPREHNFTLDRERSSHEQEIIKLYETHDNLVEDMVKNCEQAFLSFEDCKKEEAQIKQQIDEIRISLFDETSTEDSSSTTDKCTHLKTEVSNSKQAISRKKVEQEEAITKSKLKHSDDVKQVYTSHNETITPSKTSHSRMIEEQKQATLGNISNSLTRHQKLCNMYNSEILAAQEKIKSREECIEVSKHQTELRNKMNIDFVIEYHNLSNFTELLISHKQGFLEAKIEYLLSKLDTKDDFDLETMIEQQQLDFNVMNSATCPNNKAGNDMIMLLNADRNRLHEQIASLKSIIGEEDEGDGGNFGKDKDIDMTEEIAVMNF